MHYIRHHFTYFIKGFNVTGLLLKGNKKIVFDRMVFYVPLKIFHLYGAVIISGE